jgi:adenylosuccinate lyase
MIPRYQTTFMKELWSDEYKYKTWFAVEVAYLEAYLKDNQKADNKLITALRAKGEKINWATFSRSVERYDEQVKHDVIAFLHALEDELGEQARLIHVGLTSSDIVDTAFAILLKKAGDEIRQHLKELIDVLWQRATECRGLMCLGRTHGQAAEPTTFGIKLLSHLSELLRSHQRLSHAIAEISVGKFSGAVGVYAHTSLKAEEMALDNLGLAVETIATQVVARDRHATFFTTLAVLAGSIERLAVEIRLLMHGQIKEVLEPFSSKQKGSSAMPHKKNPVLSENLTGLMRLMRSYAQASLENQALWHERDISHSSVERVIAPDATSIMDFALVRLKNLIKNLVIDADRMKQNLAPSKDALYSQMVMLALINKGLMRQQAYEIVQQAVLKSEGKSFCSGLKELLAHHHLTNEEIDAIFSSELTVPTEEPLFERAHELMLTTLKKSGQ